MKIQTADEKFNYSVWFVLDKIRDDMIPNKSEVSYPFDINVKRSKPITFWNEKRAIDYLIAEKVIQDIGEPDIIESGEKGSNSYSASEIYHYKVNRKKFFDFHETFRLKVFSKNSEKIQKDLIRKKVLEYIESQKLGKKQRKLLQLLSGLNPIRRSVLESETRTENLTALIRDMRKSLKPSSLEILLVRSGSISKENSYQLNTIS